MKVSENELVLWVSEAAIAGTTIVLVALTAACAVLTGPTGHTQARSGSGHMSRSCVCG